MCVEFSGHDLHKPYGKHGQWAQGRGGRTREDMKRPQFRSPWHGITLILLSGTRFLQQILLPILLWGPSIGQAGNAYIPEDDLEFLILLPVPLEFWDYRYMAQCLTLLEPRERIQGFMHARQPTDIHGQPNRPCLLQLDSCSWHCACLAM